MVILLAFITLSGCTDNGEINKFVGVWEWSNDTQEYEYTFYENGSFYSYYFNNEDDDKHEGWGDFELLEKNKIHMYTSHGYGGESDDATYIYEFRNDNTKLDISTDTQLIMTLDKK